MKITAIAEAHKRNHAGESLATIAESLGMTRNALRCTLTRYRRAHGLEAPPRDHYDPTPAEAPVLVLVVPVDRVAVLTILPAEAQEIRHQHRQHREVMEVQG